MKKRVAMMMLAVMTMLSGCGKTNIEEQMERDLADLGAVETQQDAAQTEKTQGEDAEIESFQMKIWDKAQTANVTVASDTSMHSKIYEAKKYLLDENAFSSLADSIFDGGEYESLSPYGNKKEEDLVSETDCIREYLEKNEDEGVVISIDMMHFSSDSDFRDHQILVGSEYVSSEFEFDPAHTLTEIPYQIGEEPQSFHMGRLVGEINQVPYELKYSDMDDANKLVLVRRCSKYLPESYHGMDDENLSQQHGENLCKESDALAIAEEYLDQFGCEGFELAQIGTITASDKNKETVLNGYHMVYTRVFEDVQCDPTKAAGIFGMADEDSVAPIESVVIDVDSQGLFSIEVYKQYEIGDCLSEEATLLKLEQVKEILSSQEVETMTITSQLKLELRYRYMPVQTGDDYAFMPVWEVCEPSSNWSHVGAFEFDNISWVVNAVDGTLYKVKYGFGFPVQILDVNRNSTYVIRF